MVDVLAQCSQWASLAVKAAEEREEGEEGEAGAGAKGAGPAPGQSADGAPGLHLEDALTLGELSVASKRRFGVVVGCAVLRRSGNVGRGAA